VPVAFLNVVYGRKTLALNRRLHDQLEQEVEVIGRGGAAEGRGHYGAVARWRVGLSDGEAVNFSLMEVFSLGLMALALARFCTLPGTAPGRICAAFAYLWMFVAGLDGVPLLVQRVSRLRDIGRRVRFEDADGATLPGRGP